MMSSHHGRSKAEPDRGMHVYPPPITPPKMGVQVRGDSFFGGGEGGVMGVSSAQKEERQMIYLPQFDGQLYGLDRIKAGQAKRIQQAKKSQQVHGDPIDGLEELLGTIFPVNWCSVCNGSTNDSAGGCNCVC